jgi:predicted PurR-regulated permease PerM
MLTRTGSLVTAGFGGLSPGTVAYGNRMAPGDQAAGNDPHAEENPGTSAVALVLDPMTFVYVLVGLLGVFALFAFLRAAPNSIRTVAIGAVFGLALDPLVSAICRNWGWPRSRSVLLVGVGAISLATGVVYLMAPQAADQARKVSSDLPSTVKQFYDLPIVGGWLEQHDAANRAQQAVTNVPGNISDASLARTVEGMIGGALSAVLVLAIAIAILLDGDFLVASVRRQLPARWAGRADEIARVVYTSVAKYFGGSLVVAAMMGVVVLALCLIFSVPLAPLAALWAMLTDLIPQIGGFLGGALLGLLALTQGPFTFVIVLALYVLYMNIENHLISPAIVGRAVDITPPTTMLAALVGGAAAGVPGALVGPPLVGAVKQLYLQLRWGQQPFESDTRPGFAARIMTRIRKASRRKART